MRPAAWVNQALAVWLIGFLVFGFGDSASATEIASHGIAALVLLLASWRMLTELVGHVRSSLMQLLAGAWLCLTPSMFQYPARSFAALSDVTVGTTAVVAALIEVWASVHTTGRIRHARVQLRH